jgi:hypothetical protein
MRKVSAIQPCAFLWLFQNNNISNGDITMMKKQKSLGSLRIQQKTKPRSPELKGTIRIQRHTLEAITNEMDDDDEVTSNLAAWKHHDGNDFYLSVELSPKYESQSVGKRRPESRSIFDFIEEQDA